MLKLFIADDEANVRSGLKFIVDWGSLGFQLCGEASNGEDTLDSILKLKPDLVLLDIHMPRLHGTEVVKLAFEHGFHGKFIILSGYSEFKYAQQAMQYGVNYYLTKPIDEEELRQAVLSIKSRLQKEQKGFCSLNQYKEKAKNTILNDLITGDLLTFDSIDLDELNLSSSFYQVLICENYHQDGLNAAYRFADLLRVSNQNNHFFDCTTIHEKEIILLKGSLALERFKNVIMHYNNKPQKGSPLDFFFLSYGRIVHSPKEIPDSYHDALTLLNRRFFCKEEQHALGFDEDVSTNQLPYEATYTQATEYSKNFTA